MCYSAEAWMLYDDYVKEFGADIDIKAFWEIYLERDEKYRIRKKLSDGTKIPKGMDLNFKRPKSELERKGSTPLTRTLQLSLMMGQEECHAAEKAL